MTPRTALLTWTEPEVPPTGYLLSFDTPGGQIQVPQPCLNGRLLSIARFGGAPLAFSPSADCPLSVSRKSCFQQEPPPTGFSASSLPPSTEPSYGLFGARASRPLCPLPLLQVLTDTGPEHRRAAGV